MRNSKAGEISIRRLVIRFWKLVSPTWFMVVLESVSLVALPLVIGWTVDGLLQEDFGGLILLTGVCIVLLAVKRQLEINLDDNYSLTR